MEVSAYDEALAIPTEDSATLALRVQQVIQEETGVTSVSDPLAGSYYVESLTDQMAGAAMEFVEQIEAQGGYVAAQQSGWIRREVENSATRWRDMVNDGEKKIVGMNCYTSDEEQQEATFKVDEEVERIAIERIKELREKRDAKRYEKAMAAFAASANAMAKTNLADFNGHGLMDAAIEAARADATTGEMMGVMKAAFGWAAPHEF